MTASHSAIDVKELRFAYPDGRVALSGVTFQVAAGEALGLVGPNGAGKTTLFLCLAGVLPIAPGSVQVMGFDPGVPAQRRRLPAQVGIVFQNSDDQLFSTTVGDDVAFGPLNLELSAADVRLRVADALGRVGLAGSEARVPLHLSGGEKRRAALAGVLAMHPQVLLLDEPSMFLDPRGRRDVIGLLRALEGTKIVAAHDLDLIVELCPRVLLLDSGTLVADGATATLLGDAGLMTAHGLEVPWSLRKMR